jgi:hypothetical protein
MSKQFKSLYGTYLGNTGNSTKIKPTFSFLQEYVKENGWFNIDYDVQEQFLERFPAWIKSSKLNKVDGLDSFPFKYVSLGATQSLDWFHYEIARNNLRLRMLRGEYPYNRDVHEFYWDWFIEREGGEPLKKGDAVIMSVPFSGAGHLHPMYYDVLKQCDSLDIPVLIDCAWFGTCYGLEWTVDFNCIKMVTFSTTKGLGTGQFRSGICFTKWKYGPLSVQTEWHHGIHTNTFVGNLLMDKFSPDTVPNLYKNDQHEVCEFFGLTPSPTIHIASGKKGEWDYFHRDEAYNRINIKDAVFDCHNKKFYNNVRSKLKNG